MVRRNVHVSVIVAALLMFVVACSQDHPTAATSCDQFGVGCTPEQLGTWEQAEQARVNRRAAESEAAFDEATLLWPGGVLFHRDDDDDDDDDNTSNVHPWLLQCQPQRYEGEVRLIGPSGGTVKFGPHYLRIPAGALDHYVVITGEIEVSSHVLADLSPHGLTFAAPAVLELAFDHCLTPNSTVQVVYVNDDLSIISFFDSPPGATPPGGARAELWHFSKYAVAY